MKTLIEVFRIDRFRFLYENSVVTRCKTTVTDKCNLIKDFKLHYWPCVMSGWFMLTLIITYSISVSKKHAYKFFPYISDTGTYPPESCIFGQLVNLGTLMMVLNLYLRYRQVELMNNSQDIDCSKLNRYSKWCAIVGCLGMSVVANFQKMSMRGIHFLGADMVLMGGILYTIFQAKLSYDLRQLEAINKCYGIKYRNIILRIATSAICIVLFFVVIGCGYASEVNFQGDLIWWTPKDKGYVSHVIATISEWMIVILICVFIISFTDEFKALKFSGIQFQLNI